jgi:hypothetical protein
MGTARTVGPHYLHEDGEDIDRAKHMGSISGDWRGVWHRIVA